MKQEHIQQMLTLLGCTKIKPRANGWVSSTCPFTWKHAKGIDSHPSFAVLIAEDDLSMFRCQACNSFGNLTNLVFLITMHKSSAAKEVAALVRKNDTVSIAKLQERLSAVKTYGTRKPVDVGGIKLSPLAAPKRLLDTPPKLMDEAELRNFSPLPDFVVNHLRIKRGLTKRTLEAWGLLWHGKASRIVIPIRNCQGQLVGVTGRFFAPVGVQESSVPYLHSKGFQRDLYLFGEDKTDPDTDTAYIVEGQFDAIALWQYGYRAAVALLGTHLSQVQCAKLLKWYKKIVLVLDGDAPGRRTAEAIRERIGGRLPVKDVVLPDELDPDELTLPQRLEYLGLPTVKL